MFSSTACASDLSVMQSTLTPALKIYSSSNFWVVISIFAPNFFAIFSACFLAFSVALLHSITSSALFTVAIEFVPVLHFPARTANPIYVCALLFTTKEFLQNLIVYLVAYVTREHTV